MLMLLLGRSSCDRQLSTRALHRRPCTSLHTLELLNAPFFAALTTRSLFRVRVG
jgi:hypothetical protein